MAVSLGENCKKHADKAWQMATYKVPQIRLIDKFPLTTTGKVKKEVLKKEFLKETL